jgi:hypothetical protein
MLEELRSEPVTRSLGGIPAAVQLADLSNLPIFNFRCGPSRRLLRVCLRAAQPQPLQNGAAISELLKPYDARLMRSFPVSTRINCIHPILCALRISERRPRLDVLKGRPMNTLHTLVLSSVLLTTGIARAQTPANTSASPAATPANKDVVAIQTVIGEIRDALVRVQKELKGKQLPPL